MKKHPANKQQKQQQAVELRTTIQGSRLEARESAEGEKRLAGYAVVFNSPANIGGAFFETIAPGSFTQTLRNDDQIMLRDHKSELLLGRRSAGTLALTQDQRGVAFEVTLPDTELGRDTYENVRLGNLKGCSFGFFVRDDEWNQDASGNLTRIIKDVRCFEVTLTSLPAYDSTSVDVSNVRANLTKRDDDDDNDECDPDSDAYDPDADCDEEREECDCDCDDCEEDNCLECSNVECASEACLANRCGVQERHMHFALITRRLRR
jgi:HK97 family phage prohead protease